MTEKKDPRDDQPNPKHRAHNAVRGCNGVVLEGSADRGRGVEIY
jgi:hypothetical protein